MELSKEYLEFRKAVIDETKAKCSACKRSMAGCRCSHIHPSALGKVPKAGNPDNYFKNDLQNIKINTTLLGEN